MKREIRLEVVEFGEYTVKFKIVKQTHKCSSFTPEGNEFKPTFVDNFVLKSYYQPQVDDFSFYLRGSDNNLDNITIYVSRATYFTRIVPAIAEYNLTNGGEKLYGATKKEETNEIKKLLGEELYKNLLDKLEDVSEDVSDNAYGYQENHRFTAIINDISAGWCNGDKDYVAQGVANAIYLLRNTH